MVEVSNLITYQGDIKNKSNTKLINLTTIVDVRLTIMS